MHLCRAVAVGQHIFFNCLGDVGDAARWYFFYWRVVALGLWVRIGTADEGRCYAADAAVSTVGVVLGGGMQLLGHTSPPPSHYL